MQKGTRKKEYRQRNRNRIRNNGQEEGSNFISYSNFLKKKEENEMKILQKLDYHNSDLPVKKNDNDMFLFLKQKGRQQTQANMKSLQQAMQLRQRQASCKQKLNNKQNKSHNTQCGLSSSQQYQQIDTSAVVIKGKLIYLKQETDKIKSTDHLAFLLKQNNISNKEYLTGNQKEILAKISNNEDIKENEIIKDYILRNMSEQNNGEVIVMERFHEVKAKLFD